MGAPSFNGVHDKRKAQVLYCLHRFAQHFPNGHGLILNEVAELVGVSKDHATHLCLAHSRWKYLSVALAPKGRRQCIYKITAKGSQWLTRWSPLIPWERYGWNEQTIAEIDRKIKEMVEFRGYK